MESSGDQAAETNRERDPSTPRREEDRIQVGLIADHEASILLITAKRESWL
jgi:hypothetical protein